MENVKALKETLATFVECVDSVENMTAFAELDAVERKAVAALQLAEVQIAAAGDDLYHAVLIQRRKINNGEVIKEVKKDEPSDNTEAKASKPRRAKRKTKRSTK